MELLTSILAAVEAQNTRIATLTEQQKKLAGFVKVMDEETTRRAERIIAATAKLEVRQLWSAAAMCLVLLPVAVVVAGLWMGIAGLITGVQWALDVDGSVWLGIGRWLVVGAGLAGCQVPGFVETCLGRFLSCCCVLVFCLLWCDSAQGEVRAACVVPVDPG